MTIKVRLNSQVDYENGVIRTRMNGQGRCAPSGIHEAELVERVTGWGKSNVLVRWGGYGFTFLATEDESD